MVATCHLPTPDGQVATHYLASLQSFSYSCHTNRIPIRNIGSINVKDYVSGPRTIAGSLIFTVFNKHFAYEIIDNINSNYKTNESILVDELPPFDVTISLANEYGAASRLAVYGIQLVNEGQVMSVNDIYTENTYQYVARSIEYLNDSTKYSLPNNTSEETFLNEEINNSQIRSEDATDAINEVAKTQTELNNTNIIQYNELSKCSPAIESRGTNYIKVSTNKFDIKTVACKSSIDNEVIKTEFNKYGIATITNLKPDTLYNIQLLTEQNELSMPISITTLKDKYYLYNKLTNLLFNDMTVLPQDESFFNIIIEEAKQQNEDNIMKNIFTIKQQNSIKLENSIARNENKIITDTMVKINNLCEILLPYAFKIQIDELNLLNKDNIIKVPSIESIDKRKFRIDDKTEEITIYKFETDLKEEESIDISDTQSKVFSLNKNQEGLYAFKTLAKDNASCLLYCYTLDATKKRKEINEMNLYKAEKTAKLDKVYSDNKTNIDLYSENTLEKSEAIWYFYYERNKNIFLNMPIIEETKFDSFDNYLIIHSDFSNDFKTVPDKLYLCFTSSTDVNNKAPIYRRKMQSMVSSIKYSERDVLFLEQDIYIFWYELNGERVSDVATFNINNSKQFETYNENVRTCILDSYVTMLNQYINKTTNITKLNNIFELLINFESLTPYTMPAKIFKSIMTSNNISNKADLICSVLYSVNKANKYDSNELIHFNELESKEKYGHLTTINEKGSLVFDTEQNDIIIKISRILKSGEMQQELVKINNESTMIVPIEKDNHSIIIQTFDIKSIFKTQTFFFDVANRQIKLI